MMDFLNPFYLSKGNDKQKKVYEFTRELEIFSLLKKYNPIIVGTIPINIDIETSDIDIICEVYDIKVYEKIIYDNFSKYNKFEIYQRNTDIIIVRLVYKKIPIEIFAQDLDTKKQFAYRHMIIENKILSLLNEDFRLNIVNLKNKGYKTEKAFCELLNIKGNSFLKLLELEYMSDSEIMNFAHSKYQK